MRIPSRLKIGGHFYKILKDYHFKENTSLYGQTDYSLLEIRLSKYDGGGNILPNTKYEEVFIHEILHAIDEAYNNKKCDEEIIERLSNGIYQVFKDNKLLRD